MPKKRDTAVQHNFGHLHRIGDELSGLARQLAGLARL